MSFKMTTYKPRGQGAIIKQSNDLHGILALAFRRIVLDKMMCFLARWTSMAKSFIEFDDKEKGHRHS